MQAGALWLAGVQPRLASIAQEATGRAAEDFPLGAVCVAATDPTSMRRTHTPQAAGQAKAGRLAISFALLLKLVL